MSEPIILTPFINGEFVESAAVKYTDVFDPSTGEIIAKAPQCTAFEIEKAVAAAKAAYGPWKNIPAHKRAQYFFRLRELLREHLEELTGIVARENGKVWSEAEGDVLKAIEMTEIATSIPALLMGEALMDTSLGYDTTLYREPMGVFAGIAPWNFPAMIPMGWMAPIAIACGNTYVLKAASMTPMTALRIAELYKAAGFPDGVINVVTCSRNEAELLLSHQDVKGITFVGSTAVGRAHSTPLPPNTASGCRRCAKPRTTPWCSGCPPGAEPLPGSSTRPSAVPESAAWPCPWWWWRKPWPISWYPSSLPRLRLKIGPAYDKSLLAGSGGEPRTDKQFVTDWIERASEGGAELVLDGTRRHRARL